VKSLTDLIVIALLALATEAVTEILTSSELTEPFRSWWKRFTYPIDTPPPNTSTQRFYVWFDKLISCGYCTSVWVAGFFSLFCPPLVDNWISNWLCTVFIVHRLANWLHVCFKLLQKGRVNTHDFLVKLQRESDVPDELRELGESQSEGISQTESTDSGTGDNQVTE
jgi:hypothetical protein